MIEAELGRARVRSFKHLSDVEWMRSQMTKGADQVERVEAPESQSEQYVGPFTPDWAKAAQVVAKEMGVECTEVAADPEHTAEQGATVVELVRLQLTPPDGQNLEAFWRALLERGHQNIANGPTNAERAAIAAKDVAAAVLKARAGEMGQHAAATPQIGDIILTPRLTFIRPTSIDFEAAARLGNISDAERAARGEIAAAAIARADGLQETIKRRGVDNDPVYDDTKFVEDMAKKADVLQPNEADEAGAGYKLANDSIPPKRSNRIEY